MIFINSKEINTLIRVCKVRRVNMNHTLYEDMIKAIQSSENTTREETILNYDSEYELEMFHDELNNKTTLIFTQFNDEFILSDNNWIIDNTMYEVLND